jgi:nucleotide-binding universal stress UspA family protein
MFTEVGGSVDAVPPRYPTELVREGGMSENVESTSVIAVGVDESESSRRALRWAAQEALRRGTGLEVVTAWSWDAIEGASLAEMAPNTMQNLAEQTQNQAIEEVLEAMSPRPEITRRVVQASATQALAEASQHADLVVVGTHGRGPVRSFLLGSVSLSVIKNAACPVVVMPPMHETPEPSTRLTAAST